MVALRNIACWPKNNGGVREEGQRKKETNKQNEQNESKCMEKTDLR